MSQEILNFDEIKPSSSREFVLKGVSYLVTELTTEEFLEAVSTASHHEEKSAERLKQSPAEYVEGVIARIIKRAPEVTRDVLGSVGLSQLHAIEAFVTGIPVKVILEQLGKSDESKPAEEGTPAGN